MTMNSEAGLNIEVRDVVRPDSTTRVISIPFHIIKNRQETENVFKGVAEEDIILIQRMVNTVTFQPEMAIMIRRKQPRNMALEAFNQFYIASMEWIQDVKAMSPDNPNNKDLSLEELNVFRLKHGLKPIKKKEANDGIQ